MCNRELGKRARLRRSTWSVSLPPLLSYFTNDDLIGAGEGLHTKISIPMLILWCHFFKDMGLIFGGSILPVWLGSTRTRSPQVPPPPDSILPMQIMTSSFHHFIETVQGFDKIAYFHQENDLEETLF
ncbi:UNVERIFIED_CONTAM: hypothetical protein NCL1_13400 [Trichonephila clavipes]